MRPVHEYKHVRLIPIKRMKNLLFLFPRSGNKAKCGVEFHHLIRYASRMWWKLGIGIVLVGTECLNTRLPNSRRLLCYVHNIKLKVSLENHIKTRSWLISERLGDL